LRTARVWQLGADPQQSALFTGRVPAAEAYRLACQRRDTIVNHRDDTLNAEALRRSGAILVRGHGHLREPGVLDVDGRTLRYGELVINTGSAPRRPDIPGLDVVAAWTSDDALSTTELPASMLVLGGGAVGCELAFLFATFGTAVTLVQRHGEGPLDRARRHHPRHVHAAVYAGARLRTGVAGTPDGCPHANHRRNKYHARRYVS